MKGDTELKRAKEYLGRMSEVMEHLMTSEAIKAVIEPSALAMIREIMRDKFNVDVAEYQLLLEAQGKTSQWSEADDELIKNYLSIKEDIGKNNWNEEWKRLDSLVLLTGRSKNVIKKHAIRLGFENKIVA